METIGIIDRLIGLFDRFKHVFFPPKPNLNFEAIDCVHWYDKNNSQSGIIVEMFIINRGKKPTTIRKIDIVSMTPDHLQYKQWVRTDPIELLTDKDTKYRETFFFRGDHLRYEKIKFVLEFTHTEDKDTLELESKLIPRLKATFKAEN